MENVKRQINLVSEIQKNPYNYCIYGTKGVGKTTVCYDLSKDAKIHVNEVFLYVCNEASKTNEMYDRIIQRDANYIDRVENSSNKHKIVYRVGSVIYLCTASPYAIVGLDVTYAIFDDINLNQNAEHIINIATTCIARQKGCIIVTSGNNDKCFTDIWKKTKTDAYWKNAIMTWQTGNNLFSEFAHKQRRHMYTEYNIPKEYRS